nr:MAG TPA: hypothetical protein [Inoviridae sp.]
MPRPAGHIPRNSRNARIQNGSGLATRRRSRPA